MKKWLLASFVILVVAFYIYSHFSSTPVDYHQILGVSKNASYKEIRKFYRRLYKGMPDSKSEEEMKIYTKKHEAYLHLREIHEMKEKNK